MKFYDIVDKRYDPKLKQRVLTFPDMEPCEKCGSSRYVPADFPEGGYIDSPHLAIQIALVKFGYTDDFKDPTVPEPKPCCELGDSDPDVRSVLALDRKWGMFPTQSVCSGCGGYRGVFRKDSIGGPHLAWRTALVSFGEQTCKHFDNTPPSHPCDCDVRLAELDKEIAKLPLEKDSGWMKAGGLPHRGITDFARNMEFERDLTEEEMLTLREWLQRKDCPGWTGVMKRTFGSGKYGFTTTWDSSD